MECERDEFPILVVDDDAASRRALAGTLRRWEWSVVEARSGGEALAQLGRGRFRAVFTDLYMPGLDGYAVVRQIRSRERRDAASPMPVFAVSADTASSVRDQCRRVGLTGVLAKPIVWDTLWQVLASLEVASTPALVSETEERRAVAEGAEIDALIRELLPLFFDSRRGDMEAMRAFLETEDIVGLQRVGHTLKGCGGSYGFPWVTELGAQIEVAAGLRDFASCRSMLEQLADHLAQAELKHTG